MEKELVITTEVKNAYNFIDSGRNKYGLIELINLYFNKHEYVEHWQTLFDFYNNATGANYKLGCRPCFVRVFKFIHDLINIQK